MMKYDGLVGNEKTKEQINSLISSNRLPHALLLEGPRGSGKHTLARLIAAALVCTCKDVKPCGQCSACIKCKAHSHPDIIEIEGRKEKGITVDMIREIRRDIYILPNESNYKIYIINNAQNMNELAQNALLKILEEPPEHGIFILNCQSRYELIPTVLSRTTSFTLSGVSEKDAVQFVQKYLPQVELSEIEEAAVVWCGVIGQILDGLQSGKLKKVIELSTRIIQEVTASRELDLLLDVGKLEKDKELFVSVLSMLKLILRDSLVLLIGGETTISGCKSQARYLSELLTQKQIFQIISEIEEIENALQYNGNPALLVTRFCYDLRRCVGR